MGRILNRLLYHLADWRKITEIVVTYELKTDSGYTIMCIESVSKVSELCVHEKYKSSEREKEIEEDGRGIMNKEADKILQKYRKKRIIEGKNGAMITGKYIKACSWKLHTNNKDATFEEFVKAKGE